jgi:hypothetical protein
LALSRDTRNGADLIDVAMVMAAFEAINNVSLEVRCGLVGGTNDAQLSFVFTAFTRETVDAAPVLLASVTRRAPYSKARTMDAAILQGLYALDAEMARKEFTGVLKE